MTKDRTRIDATTFNASETLFEMTDSSNLESDESCHRENHSIEHPEPTSNHIADHNFQGKHEKLLQNYPGNVKIDGCTYFLKKESIAPISAQSPSPPWSTRRSSVPTRTSRTR